MLTDIATWLNETGLALAVRNTGWAFPTIEAVHVLAITTVVGMIAIMDLRLLGVPNTQRKISDIGNETLPWVWGAFGLAVITGGLMFVSQALVYVENSAFLIKMGLIALAGINMIAFEFLTARNMPEWDHGVSTPTAAKVAAFLSLGFWIGVVIAGRIIGFTLNMLAGTDFSQYLN